MPRRDALNLHPGAAAVIANGRVTHVHGVVQRTEELVAEDFQLLQLLLGKYNMGTAIAKEVQSMLSRGVLQVLQGSRQASRFPIETVNPSVCLESNHL
jgi:hypothetical protein